MVGITGGMLFRSLFDDEQSIECYLLALQEKVF